MLNKICRATAKYQQLCYSVPYSCQLSTGWFVCEGCSISFDVVVPFVSTIWNNCWIRLLNNNLVVVVVECEF